MTARSTADETRAERRAAGRRVRWEPQPRDWRWAVGTVGKVLIATGTLMFAFVGYQLWGTGLEYAQAQDRLDDEFEDLLAGAAVPTSVPTSPGTSPVSPPATSPVTSPVTPPVTSPVTSLPNEEGPPATTAPSTASPETVPDTVPVPAFAEGDVMARLEIPRIGLDAKVVAGVQPDDLKQGPGHYPGTPMPGQLGNSAIAGHRTTYGQPFFELNEVLPDDEIILTTVQGRFVYRMTGAEVVGPDAGHVVATTDPDVATLTLTTCEPRYTATNRLVVYARLDVAASGAGLPPVLTYGSEEPTGTDAPAAESTTAPVATLVGEPATRSTAPTTPTEPPTTPAGAPATTAEGPADTVAAITGDSTAPTASADAFSHGWFSDDAAFGQVALWGLALTSISIGAYLLSRRVRRNWVGALAGIVPFVVALYFFFQNVNRLLPAAI